MQGVVTRFVPTDAEVEQLRERYGAPAEETLITYDELMELLQIERHATRFKSVISAWRRKLYREYNVLLKCEPSVGYIVQDNHGRVDTSSRRFKAGLRRVSSATDIVMRTDREGMTTEERRHCDAIISVGATMRLATATEAKKLTLSLP